MAAARYTKGFMPLNKVREKEFLSRPMGCKGVGFSFVRYKPGAGATYVHRHKIQEEVHYFERNRFDYSGREADFDARGDGYTCRSDGLSGARQRLKKGRGLYDSRGNSAEKLSAWRENFARRWYSRSEEGAALEKIGA